jgi:hypothetical protein
MTTALQQIEVSELDNDVVLIRAKVSGKLDRSDYEEFGTAFEDAMKRTPAKVRLLIEMEHLEGMTAGAMWEDLKFDVKHFNDIERLAVVGERKSEKIVTDLFKPFTLADVRWFDSRDLEGAEAWVMA